MNFMLPVESPSGDASFAGQAFYSNVVFNGFSQERPYCGGDSIKAIVFNKGASDIIPPVTLDGCTFNGSNDLGLVYMF